jgi:hypothetical protein
MSLDGCAPRSIPEKALDLVCAADVTQTYLDALWDGVLWRGKLTAIAGQPGLGKSLLTLDIAARLTKGEPMPGEMGPQQPRTVLIASAEDDPADTMMPRLVSAGADLSRVQFINGASDGKFLCLGPHAEELQAAIIKTGADLVILDPLSAYIGKVDSHKDSEVRQVLSHLTKLAQETQCAILAVHHLNKGNGGAAIARVSGSGAFVAATRSSWLVATANSEDQTLRHFTPLKVNLGPNRGGYTFRLDQRSDGPHIAWDAGRCTDITADDLLDVDARARGKHARVNAATNWLRGELSAPRSAQDVKDAARAAGYPRQILDPAVAALGIVKTNPGGGKWVWSLPQS